MFGAVSNIQMADKYKKVDASIIKVLRNGIAAFRLLKWQRLFSFARRNFF